jgi:hypothetical protein
MSFLVVFDKHSAERLLGIRVVKVLFAALDTLIERRNEPNF